MERKRRVLKNDDWDCRQRGGGGGGEWFSGKLGFLGLWKVLVTQKGGEERKTDTDCKRQKPLIDGRKC